MQEEPDTEIEKGVFFTANGKEDVVQRGLDLVREAIEEASHREWLSSGKSCAIKYKGDVFVESKSGKNGIRRALIDDPDKLKTLIDALNRG